MCRIKYKHCEYRLEYTKAKNNLIEYKCLCCNKNYPKMFHENLQRRFPDNKNLLTMVLIHYCYLTILFYCCKKVFTHKNTLIIGKNSMKHHHQKIFLQSLKH